jgi:hypothetical protein
MAELQFANLYGEENDAGELRWLIVSRPDHYPGRSCCRDGNPELKARPSCWKRVMLAIYTWREISEGAVGIGRARAQESTRYPMVDKYSAQGLHWLLYRSSYIGRKSEWKKEKRLGRGVR